MHVDDAFESGSLQIVGMLLAKLLSLGQEICSDAHYQAHSIRYWLQAPQCAQSLGHPGKEVLYKAGKVWVGQELTELCHSAE